MAGHGSSHCLPHLGAAVHQREPPCAAVGLSAPRICVRLALLAPAPAPSLPQWLPVAALPVRDAIPAATLAFPANPAVAAALPAVVPASAAVATALPAVVPANAAVATALPAAVAASSATLLAAIPPPLDTRPVIAVMTAVAAASTVGIALALIIAAAAAVTERRSVLQP